MCESWLKCCWCLGRSWTCLVERQAPLRTALSDASSATRSSRMETSCWGWWSWGWLSPWALETRVLLVCMSLAFLSYPSTFLRILAECIRIKNRSKEEGVVVLNSKSGDFGSYSLPRLSAQSHDQERGPQASAQRALQTGDGRRESRRVDVPILIARKGKIKCKQKT